MKTSTLINTISGLLVGSPTNMIQAENPDLEGSTIAGTGLTSTRFWIDVQSQDTGKYRNRTTIRVNHDITISFLCLVKPKQAFSSHKAIMDVEGLIIDLLMDQSKIPSIRTQYIDSTRAFVLSGKAMLIELEFSMEDSYTIGESTP